MIEFREDVSGFILRWDTDNAAAARVGGYWPDRTIADFAAEIVAATPDRIMLHEGGRSFTAAQLWAEAASLASALRARGYRPGDVIAFQLPNWAEVNVIGLATAMAGLVAAPIVPIYRENEVRFMLGEVKAKAIFLPRLFRKFDYVEMIGKVEETLGHPLDIFVLRGDSGRYTGYEALVAEGNPQAVFPRVDPDALRLILFTSGTTGRAKAVLHTHNSLTAENIKTARRRGYTAGDCWYIVSPMTHVTGFIYGVNMVWAINIPAVLAPVWEPEQAFEDILHYGVTIMGGATPFLKGLVEVSQARGIKLEKLRVFGCGGTSIPADLITAARSCFPNALVARGFGASEVPTLTCPPTSRDDIYHATETDGLAFEVDMKVVDAETGASIPIGDEGEVLAKCPQMFMGYIRDEDNASAFDPEGYFRMGDIGTIDADGWFTVTGRKKDLINRLGEKISAREIEDILFSHPDIADAAVVAMPSERTGEAVCAFIIPRAGKAPTLEDVAAFVAGRGVAKQKLPEHVELVGEFPRVPSGKVRKDELRRQIAQLQAERKGA